MLSASLKQPCIVTLYVAVNFVLSAQTYQRLSNACNAHQSFIINIVFTYVVVVVVVRVVIVVVVVVVFVTGPVII